MRRRSPIAVLAASLASAIACSSSSGSAPSIVPPPAPAIAPEAGFLEVPSRDVTVKGAALHIDATARLFYNLRPADQDPEEKPILILFNGFAAEVVRAFGTGPTTVAEGGEVVANASSFTSFANLVYLEPRQAGYSYDVIADRAPNAADCAPSIFNEYVDAADVLFAALTFLELHPALHGPVYWVGESYAGVRITWILAYARGRWDLASYEDPTLEAKIAAASARARSIVAGQILLEAWMAGGAHTNAINAECIDPVVLAGVASSVTTPCASTNACACATANDRSPYNYGYTVERQTTRETEASAAHISPDKAAALIGVPLASIPMLAASEREKGFKCSPPDDTVPAEEELVNLLGALPTGQSYYVPYSPLQPGKETTATTLDWRTANLEGIAFMDNLRDVPAFATEGALDLVVPPRALAPALQAIAGASAIDTTTPDRLGVTTPDGVRFIDRFAYASSGHMVEMTEPDLLARDVASWLANR